MILNQDIYDMVLDNISDSENGQLGFSMFNRLSRRAELRALDFISGDIENIKPPTPYTSQKLKDILSLFIKTYPAQVENAIITKPADYYNWENAYLLGSFNDTTTCDEDADVPVVGCNTAIELLNGNQFYERCNTYIEGLQPSFKKPICKEVGNTFEFLPQDLGSIKLEYIYQPVFARIVTKFDPIYNEEVIDDNLSTPYSWPDFAIELIVYFITELWGIHTRENALQEQLKITGALVRDTKQ